MGNAALKPDIDVCAGCGKLFPRVGIALCQTCVTNEACRFDLVREFLREHPASTLPEIADATWLTRAEILRYQSEGRLIDVRLTVDDAMTCSCTPAKRCSHCRKKLAERLEDMGAEMGKNPRRFPTPRHIREEEGADRVRYVRRRHRTDSDD